MKPPAIDLARPRLWPEWLAAAVLVAMSALAGAGFWLGLSWRMEARALLDADSQVRATQGVSGAGLIPEPSVEAAEPVDSSAEAVQALLRVARAPVAELMAAVEDSIEPGLRVVRLEIDASLGEALLECEAPGYAEALAWSTRLNASPATPRWVWVRSRRQDGAAGVVFTLSANW
jgi:hypothetical protein